MMEVYFSEGASADMGIFAGYGEGWYFKIAKTEFGPYGDEQEAKEVMFEMKYGGPED